MGVTWHALFTGPQVEEHLKAMRGTNGQEDIDATEDITGKLSQLLEAHVAAFDQNTRNSRQGWTERRLFNKHLNPLQ